jgi:hypothetical protein
MQQIVLCPGLHSPILTEAFWVVICQRGKQYGLSDRDLSHLVFPDAQYWAFSAIHVNRWLSAKCCSRPLVFIAFSAGVVGALGAAWMQQLQGKSIQALIAIDGWGMPLSGTFPIYRLSHDRFSHDSSAWLGGQSIFYADPSVPHLQMWRSPDQVRGYWQQQGVLKEGQLADVICQLLSDGHISGD